LVSQATIVFIFFLFHVIWNFDHILFFRLICLRLDNFVLNLNFIIELII
jgi:hypothetical protein